MYNLEVHKQSLSLLYCKEENGPTEAAGHKEKAKEESHYILGHAFSCKRVIAGRVFSKNVHNDLENTRFQLHLLHGTPGDGVLQCHSQTLLYSFL